MKRNLVFLVFILMVLALPVRAQETPTLSTLDIALWPEFDRPEMLVIYQGALAPETPLPASVELRIPARVGQPTALAYVSEDQLLTLQFVTRQDGDWLVVAFELPTLGFQLEYYDDRLSIDSSGKREFSYSYHPDYPVANLTFQAQVPPDADEFVLEPPAGFVTAGDHGLDYHTVAVGSVEQGQELAWSLSYQKAGSKLTQDILFPEAVSSPVPAQPVPSGQEDNSNVLIFLIGFVVIVAVGGGAFWLGRRTQPLPEPLPTTPRKRRGSGHGLPDDSAQAPFLGRSEGLFCYRCGSELRPGADYCQKCGAAARR
jgi:hypothetical protein